MRYTAETVEHPTRLVDADGRTWILVAGSDPAAYRPHAKSADKPTPHLELHKRGGLRYVAAPERQDVHFLDTRFTRILNRVPGLLIPTVLAAVAETQNRVGQSLIAGNPGSDASIALLITAHSTGQTIHASGAYDQEIMPVIADVLTRWVTGPGKYVEVADNLAQALAPALARAGGWRNCIPGHHFLVLDENVFQILAWLRFHTTEGP